MYNSLQNKLFYFTRVHFRLDIKVWLRVTSETRAKLCGFNILGVFILSRILHRFKHFVRRGVASCICVQKGYYKINKLTQRRPNTRRFSKCNAQSWSLGPVGKLLLYCQIKGSCRAGYVCC